MTDFLTRLIERTQGVAKVAQPIIQPMFAMVPVTSHDYLQSSSRDNELLNAPDKVMVHSAKILPSSRESFVNTPNIPQENSSPTMPPQLPSKISDTGFAPPGKIDPEIIENASSPVSPGDLKKYKPNKENFSENSESSANGKKRELVLRGLSEAEGQQAEHSFYEKGNSSAKSIDSTQESFLQEDAEIKGYQYISQKSEHSLKEERNTSGRPIYSRKARALQEKTESREIHPYETSYLKPHIPGKVGFQQMTEKESSPNESIIKVTIGRVEVRAIMPPASAASAPRSQSPILSLNDYLQQRNEGKR